MKAYEIVQDQKQHVAAIKHLCTMNSGSGTSLILTYQF